MTASWLFPLLAFLQLQCTIILSSVFFPVVTDKPKSKRHDPNYTKITADIEKDTAAKVRAICALTELSFSDAVNDALKLWIETQKKDSHFQI